ncbi:hypothetical protein FSST1_010312 [Fusarium sambucinum]
MRPCILHSVALSLAGLQVAGASVCKPRSLSSDFSTIASTTLIPSEITSTGLALESSAISSIIISEVTTGVDTSATDAATEPVSAIETTTTLLSASIEVTSTIESTIATETTASTDAGVADTTTAPTSIETTATTEATTTTAEMPIITEFQLKGSRAPVEGAFLFSNRVRGNNLIFPGSNTVYSPTVFNIEALSGRLLVGNSLAVCALFRQGQDIASLSLCTDDPDSSEVAITCTPPVKDGDTLSCSVPAMSCTSSTTCTDTGDVLTDTSTDFNYNMMANIAVIGQISNGVGFVVHAL